MLERKKRLHQITNAYDLNKDGKLSSVELELVLDEMADEFKDQELRDRLMKELGEDADCKTTEEVLFIHMRQAQMKPLFRNAFK